MVIPIIEIAMMVVPVVVAVAVFMEGTVTKGVVMRNPPTVPST